MYLRKFGLMAGAWMLAHSMAMETYDLRDWDTWEAIESSGLTIHEGEQTELIFFENTSTGYTWSYNDDGSNGVYDVSVER